MYNPAFITNVSDYRFQYTFEAADVIYNRLGCDYINEAIKGLTRHDLRTIRLCVRAMVLDGRSTDEVLSAAPLATIAARLLDAICLQVKGKTHSELAARSAANKP